MCLVMVVMWGLLRQGLLYFGPVWSEGLGLGLKLGLVLGMLLAVGPRLASGPVQRCGLGSRLVLLGWERLCLLLRLKLWMLLLLLLLLMWKSELGFCPLRGLRLSWCSQ